MHWFLIVPGVLLLITTTVWALWEWWEWAVRMGLLPRPRRDEVDPLVALYDAEPLALPRAPVPAQTPTAETHPIDAEPVTPPHGSQHLAELVRAAVLHAMRQRQHPDVVDAVVVPDEAPIVVPVNGRRPVVDLDATGEWPVYDARPIAVDTGHQPRHAADSDDPKYLRRMPKRLTAAADAAYNAAKLEQARRWRESAWSLTTGAEVARLRAALSRELADWTALTAALTPRRTERVLVPVRLLELEAAR